MRLKRDGIMEQINEVSSQRLKHMGTMRPVWERVKEKAGPIAQPVKPRAHHKRNEPCPCGSGKKYKKCCGAKPKGC